MAPGQLPGLLQQPLRVGSLTILPEGACMVGHGGEGSGMFRSEYATGLGRRRFVEDLGLVEAALVEAYSSAAGQSSHVVRVLGAEQTADAMFILDRQRIGLIELAAVLQQEPELVDRAQGVGVLCTLDPALCGSAFTQEPLGFIELAAMDKLGSKLVFRVESGRVVLAQRRDAAREIPAR